MSERGESLGPIKALGGERWLGLRAWLIGGRGGLGPSAVRPPNTRVQRTRSSPSAPHSPLTRCPLGSRGTREQHSEIGLVLLEFGTGEMILVS